MAIFKPLAPWVWRPSKDKLSDIPFGGIQSILLKKCFIDSKCSPVSLFCFPTRKLEWQAKLSLRLKARAATSHQGQSHTSCSCQDSADPGTHGKSNVNAHAVPAGTSFPWCMGVCGGGWVREWGCWSLEPQVQTILFSLCPLITASLTTLGYPGFDHCKIWVYVEFCLCI